MSPDAYRSLAMTIFDQADRLEALAGLDLPVLVVVGVEDGPFVDPSARMAATIPGATFEVIPAAGHSPQFENTDAWWAVLTRFLKELS